jgi:hypothetical protein
MIDLRKALDWEYQMVELQIPELVDLERERTAKQWDDLLRHVRTELRRWVQGQDETRFFTKDGAPETPASKSSELPTARKYVARSKGLSADKVEAMPPAQVLLLYMKAQWCEDRDIWYQASYLPYPQALPLWEAAEKRIRGAPITEGHVLGRPFLPGLGKVKAAQVRVERVLAALRVIEAIRMYAAAHDGKLPNKLDDITEVPLPGDPGTDKPFEYSCDGSSATLVSQHPVTLLTPSYGLRFRVTIRKK